MNHICIGGEQIKIIVNVGLVLKKANPFGCGKPTLREILLKLKHQLILDIK
jgi:hypothetical protein